MSQSENSENSAENSENDSAENSENSADCGVSSSSKKFTQNKKEEEELQEENSASSSSRSYHQSERESRPTISLAYELPGDGVPVLKLASTLGYDSLRRCNLHVLAYICLKITHVSRVLDKVTLLLVAGNYIRAHDVNNSPTFCVDQDTLLMVAGNYIRVHNVQTGRDDFLRSTGDGSVSCLAVNPPAKVFAAGEIGTRPDINVFGWPSCTPCKVLSNGSQREYVALEFSPGGGDVLASLGGAPDYDLMIWDWAHEKPILRCKAFSQDVHHVSWNQDVSGFLATMGECHIRFWRMADTFTGLKLKHATGRFCLRDTVTMEASVHFPDGKVLTGSQEGTMLLWEESLLKAEFRRLHSPQCHAGRIRHMFLHEGEVVSVGQDGYLRRWSVDDIIYVDPAEPGEVLELRPLYELHVHPTARLMGAVPADPEAEVGCDLHTWYVQDETGKVWQVAMDIAQKIRPKVVLNCHGGPVLVSAVSPRTHIAATGGQDCTLRFFDCLHGNQLLDKTFPSPVSSLLWLPPSFDPAAASVMVGFDSGIIRKMALCEPSGKKPTVDPKDITSSQTRSVTASIGRDMAQPRLQAKLNWVMKAHTARVTSLVLSSDGEHFASGSSDKTLFLFKVDDDKELKPLGRVTLPTGITQLVWTPLNFSYRAILVACEGGIVAEVCLKNVESLEVTSAYTISNLTFSFFKFSSVKSELEHEQQTSYEMEVERLARIEEYADGKEQNSISASSVEGESNEEKEFEPFIPDAPSPILQIVYSVQEQHFWMSLGEYDAGYVYLCQFSHPPVTPSAAADSSSPSRSFLADEMSAYSTRPVSTVPVPKCNGAAISWMQLGVRQTLLGFSDGHIRLVQTTGPRELHELGAYWDLAAHDQRTGSVTGLHVAFDNSFLLSTAMDGNVLLFDLQGKLETLAGEDLTLPGGGELYHACPKDMGPGDLAFHLALERDRQELVVKAAEETKKATRGALKELQKKLKAVLQTNEGMPAPHRLSKSELLINRSIEEEHNKAHEERMEIVRKRNAWQSERTRLLLHKTQHGLHGHEDLPHQCVVAAFKRSMSVSTFRKQRLIPGLERFPEDPDKKDLGKQKTDSEETGISVMEKTAEFDTSRRNTSLPSWSWEQEYEQVCRQSRFVTGTASRMLAQALDKAAKSKIRREERGNQWAQLYQEKDLLDMDNVQDLEDINHFAKNIGDRKLRTDTSRAVELANSSVSDDPRTSLAELDSIICHKKRTFNEKVFKLQKYKGIVLQVHHYLRRHVFNISGGAKQLSAAPSLTKEEVPEMEIPYDAHCLMEFRKDLKHSVYGDFTAHTYPHSAEPYGPDVGLAKQYPQFESKYGFGKPESKFESKSGLKRKVPYIHSHTFYKGERRDNPDIVKLSAQTPESLLADDSDNVLMGHEDLELTSDFRKCVCTAARLHIDFEVAHANSCLKEIVDDFDNKLTEVRAEKFRLDSELKQADLDCLNILEVYHVLISTREEMLSLQALATAKQKDLNTNGNTVAELQRKIAVTTSEMEANAEKLAQLWFRFKKLCVGEVGSKMMQYLTLLFKRKVKKKQPIAEDDEECDSDEESEMSSMVSESDCSGSDAMYFSLDYCPVGLEQSVYDEVVALQPERQGLDSTDDRLKEQLAGLNKELDLRTKQYGSLKKTLEVHKANLITFYTERMVKLNAIDVAVSVLKSRIHSPLEDCIVTEIKTLNRLVNRSKELRVEVSAETSKTKAHRKKHRSIQRTVRSMEEKAQKLANRCDKEILLKFGKPVDMEMIGLVTVNPKQEFLRCKLLDQMDVDVKEIRKVQRNIDETKENLNQTTKYNTIYKLSTANILLEKLQIERRMDKRCTKVDVEQLLPPICEKRGDRDGLRKLVRQQAGAIDGCRDVINALSNDKLSSRRFVSTYGRKKPYSSKRSPLQCQNQQTSSSPTTLQDGASH